jgi:hypothetical protein
MASPKTTNTTLEYFDGFDDCSAAQLVRTSAGETATGGNGVTAYSVGAINTFTINSGNGRNGTSSLRGANDYTSLVWVGVSRATRTVGFAFKAANFNAGGGGYIGIAAFGDAGTFQVQLRLNADGTLSVVRGRVPHQRHKRLTPTSVRTRATSPITSSGSSASRRDRSGCPQDSHRWPHVPPRNRRATP